MTKMCFLFFSIRICVEYEWYKHVMALNVTKGHTFTVLDKSMKFDKGNLDTVLFQNFDVSNLTF